MHHETLVNGMRDTLESSLAIGEILCAEKERLPHGKFQDWLRAEVSFMHVRTAQRCMRLFKNREVLKCDTVSHLTGALRMLTAPKGAESQPGGADDHTDDVDERDDHPADDDDIIDVDATEAEDSAGAEEVEVEVLDHDDEADDHSQTDPDGRAIPEHLGHVFEDCAPDIKRIARDVTHLRTRIEKAAEAEPAAWAQIGVQDVTAKLKLVSEGLRLGLPYVVRCYCGGEDSENCKGCRGRGFLSKARVRCAPKELRGATE